MALVELAITLSLLILLGLGVTDLGRAYSLQTKLRNAAREGGGYAQYHPSQLDPTCDPKPGDNGDIISRARFADSSLSLSASQVTVLHNGHPYVSTTCTEIFNPGDTVTITVVSTFTPVTPIGTLFMGSSKQLSGTTTVQVVK